MTDSKCWPQVTHMAALGFGDKTSNYPLECMLPIIPQKEEDGVSKELYLFVFHMLLVYQDWNQFTGKTPI